MKFRFLACAVAQTVCLAAAHAQVVADSACEKYAVDIAAFATCDSPTRVARAETENEAIAPRAKRNATEKRQGKKPDSKKADAPPSALVGH